MTNICVYVKPNGVLVGPANPGADGSVFLNQLQSAQWVELQMAGKAACFEGESVVEYMGWDGPAGQRIREIRERLLYRRIDNYIKDCEDAASEGIAGADELEKEWRRYRRALRKIPETFNDAEAVIWPTEPKRPDF